MKISPIDIKQKFFKKVFTGGYEREDVQAFLNVLAQEWEKMSDDINELKIKLEFSEREVKKLKEIENSLYQTLKTAEETSHRMVDQASQSVDMKMREVQTQSDIILRDAKLKAKTLVEEAEAISKNIMEDTMMELKALQNDFKMMESQRDKVIVEMKGLVNDTMEKVNKVDNRTVNISIDEKIQAISDMIEKGNILPEVQNKTKDSNVVPPYVEKSNNGNLSFFDEI